MASTTMGGEAMPPKYVTTVRQLIYWEYAKLIARAAGFRDN